MHEKAPYEIRNWEVDAEVYHFKDGDDGSATLAAFDVLGAAPPALQASAA